MPPRAWMAIGPKAWRPRVEYPAIRFVRFPKERLEKDMQFHVIDGVRVPVFGVAKTLADAFRYRRVLGTTLLVEGLREALRKRKPHQQKSPSRPSKPASGPRCSLTWRL